LIPKGADNIAVEFIVLMMMIERKKIKDLPHETNNQIKGGYIEVP
jgi:hypothetical protein